MTELEGRTLGRLPIASFGCLDLPPTDAATIAAFHALPDLTGMVSDAMDLVGLSGGAIGASALASTLPGHRVVGPALTVLNVARNEDIAAIVGRRDNRLADIEAHNLARPGDVVVVQGVDGISSLGGIAATIANRQREAAIIVDGAIRDVEASRSLGLPVWSRGTTPVTGKWRLETVGVNVVVEICGVSVQPGDLVLADDNGVCFVRHEAIRTVLQAALGIAEDERRRLGLLADGIPLRDFVTASRKPR